MPKSADEALVLGIETSCDETGVAVYSGSRGLLAHELHSQVALHARYGGVVPELASRDHVRRLLPLLRSCLTTALTSIEDLDAIAYTEGPGLAGALLVGASVAHALAYTLDIPALGVHHLEAHLLSARMSVPAPQFPFIALLVSGGHSQLMQVDGLGKYKLLGETVDDAAGEAFDKTAKLLGLGYPGGPELARLAATGRTGRFKLPRPMLHSKDLNMSFSGLKTAVLTEHRRARALNDADKADLAAEFQEAVAEVLVSKSLAATRSTGISRLVVAGGVGANRRLRVLLDERAQSRGVAVFYPPLEFCTDNGAMVAFAGWLHFAAGSAGRRADTRNFSVRPRWDLEQQADAT